MESCASVFTIKSNMRGVPAAPNFSMKSSSSSLSFKPISKKLEKAEQVGKKIPFESIKAAFATLVNAFVNSAFKFGENQMILQGNFAPVDEIGEAVVISNIEGQIPMNFPEGVYIRNGPNFMNKNRTVAKSLLGTVKMLWVQGEGMLHATYFEKNQGRNWKVSYKNRYLEADTIEIEKKNKSSFLPTIYGHPPAVLASVFLNNIRFGKTNKDNGNTSIFQHGKKVYTVAEDHLPYEINIANLDTYGSWDINGTWNRPFTSHPKVAPQTGELVIMGSDVKKPYYVLGVISADGRKLIHKADLKFERPVLIHELGVTEQYNIIMQYPLEFGMQKLWETSKFIHFEKDKESKIGVMPRYGDAESIIWFQVQNHCTFHLINSFEDGDEVVVRGCRTTGSFIPGPSYKTDEYQWYQEHTSTLALNQKVLIRPWTA
ncbi:hypothetical protein Syun_002491 [Stephania yunnanensis]|uniref:Uncharacterized protein n=1 Tax=Stephania yunnanensis TaxID=152371 RepID=A0AAP0QBW0_9MAGN